MPSKPVIVVNDVHLRDNPPSSATETYQDDLFDLLHQVAVIAKERDAQVIFSGDVVDFKQPARTSHRLIQRAIEAFREFDNALVVPGNHDLQQDRLDSLMTTQPLGVIIRSGALTVLDGWHLDLPVYGVPWQQQWYNTEVMFEVFDRWRSAGGVDEGPENAVIDLDKALVVTHASIFPAKQDVIFERLPMTGSEGLPEAMGHMGYLAHGHIHDDHGVHESEGVTFCNFGALSRGSLTESNRERQVSVALWTPEGGFERIDLDARPSEEVFRITEIEQKKAEKIDLDNFLSQVGQNTLEQSTTESVRSYIEGHESVPAPVKKRAITILEHVAK